MNHESGVKMMGGIQQFVLKHLLNGAVEKNDYDTSRLRELQRGSIVFGQELENIYSESEVQYGQMRRTITEIRSEIHR